MVAGTCSSSASLPFKIERISFVFKGELGARKTVVDTVYKRIKPARSLGLYVKQVFYFIVTNCDGDSVIELHDQEQCWDTTMETDGEYEVFVIAFDQVFNRAGKSMIVTVDNS